MEPILIGEKRGKSQIQINFEHAIAAAKAQGLEDFEVVREAGKTIIRVRGNGQAKDDISAEELMKKASGL